MSSEPEFAARIANAIEQESRGKVIDLDRPFDAARVLTAKRWLDATGQRTAHTYRGDFCEWDGAAYRILHPDDLRALIYRETADHHKGTNARKVSDVHDALKAYTNLSATHRSPCWIDPQPSDPIPELLIAARNGIVDVRECRLLASSPRYFTSHALPFAYSAKARAEHWLKFLDELWGDDDEAKQVLREWFGLCLTPLTRYQKALLLYGPKRSGKGTIIRILRALLGEDNCCSPTLAGLGQRFGLAPLLGKLLAVVSDARLGGRADAAAIAETILRLTGEDAITIERKFQSDVTTTLTARLMVVSNELPRFHDDAGALPSRFIALGLNRSFFGVEDTGLTDRLLGELPGILNWALSGLDALLERGRFVQPESGEALAEELELLASPTRAFLADACIVEPGAEVPATELFEAWQGWCDHRKRRAGNEQTLGNALRAVLPGIPRPLPQPRIAGKRVRVYPGIRLRRLSDD